MQYKWKKDGEFFKPPLVVDGMAHYSPSAQLLSKAGYKPCIESTASRVPPAVPELRFSKLKIIRALGDEAWADKKEELVAAGVYDKFENSVYLSTSDPEFLQLYRSLTAEERHILKTECLYEE